jgi:membrane protease YdiL (CAAX protease family)
MGIQLLILFAILYVVYFSGSRLAEIGLSRDDITWSNALSGLIFFVGAWAFILIVRGAIVRSGYIPEKEYLYLLPTTIAQKGVWILLSVVAAFSEEITFRGFILTRFKFLTNSFWPGVILSSAAFSLGHLYQGLAGVLLTFIYGMLFAGLYIARGSIFPCVVAHFLQDVLIILAF